MAAFKLDVDQHWQELKRLVMGIVKDPMIVDDVLQTAFEKALTTRAHPQSESKILPWFKTVLKNTALDVLRSQKKRQQKELESVAEAIVSNDSFEASVCSCISSLLKTLSKEDQMLLKALDLEGVSLKDFSQKLGISKNTLKVRRHRARQRLKKVVLNVCHSGVDDDCELCEC